MVLENVEKDGDLRFLGTHNLVENFQRYCFDTYGGFEGVTNRDGLKEGAVRHQCCVSSPIGHHANSCAMRSFSQILLSYGRGKCNNAQYKSMIGDIKEKVLGFGDLKSQKAVINCASLGLFLPKSFLGFFLTGSTQQLKNLREPPFCFQRADEVVQLRRNLVTKQNILPMQADEYICSLSSKDRGGGKIYYKDHSIYSAKKLINGEVGVERLCHNRKVVEDAPELQFNYSTEQPGNHYVPQWAKLEEPIGNTLVALSSASNMEHLNISRLSTKKRDPLLIFLPIVA